MNLRAPGPARTAAASTLLAAVVLVLLTVPAAASAQAEAFLSIGGSPAGRSAQTGGPSCRSITYRGTAGQIDIQTTDTSEGPVVAWGITMYDRNESRGRWDVDTYLNGRRTTSGFHRTTTTPYVPHGSVRARSGQRFNIVASLVSASGRSYRSVPNQCFVP